MSELTAALEVITSEQFRKKYTTYKKTQIGQRIITLNEELELPRNTILHLLDNIQNISLSDTPRVTEEIFLNNTEKNSFIFHNLIPIDKTDKSYEKESFIYRTTNVEKAIAEFNREYKSFIRTVKTPEQLFSKTNAEKVINHNPLWRIKVLGRMSEYRRFLIIWKSIIKFVHTVSPSYNQVIEVPLNETIYPRDKYMGLLSKPMDNTLTKYGNDHSFYLLLNLFAHLHKKAKLKSIFQYFYKTHTKNITFMFTIHGKAIFLNLAELEEMADDASFLLRLISYFSVLKEKETEGEESLDLDTRAVLAELEQEYSQVIETNEEPGITEADPDKIIQKQRNEAIKRAKEKSSDQDIVKQIEQQKKAEAFQYIDSIPDITPAQKTRLKKRATSYEDVVFNGRTVKEILETPVDTTVVSRELDFLKGHIPDESMLKSSIVDLDKQYMDKLFEKHLIQVVTHFNKNGLFLKSLKTEDQVDELNAIRTYKIQYENDKGEVGTLRAQMPIIDEDGTFMINGIKSRMKKQLINVPICKLSSTRVSLAASYKTLIERNVSKAHSFDDFVATFIKKINKNGEVVKTRMGRRTFKDRLPYEYTQLAKKFETIKTGTLYLDTNYGDRQSINKKKDVDVDTLEQEYGVFCGRIGNNDYLFMGMDNRIRVYDTINKEIKDITTLTDLLYEHSKTDVQVPMVSEWTDLKIFDKKIPIIFVLAYKYGLTHILNYLNINYRVVDKGKRIDKESTEIVIKFKDKTIIFDRYPLEKSLILAGLLKYKTNDYELHEFDQRDVYFNMLADKGMSTNYIVGINTFFDTFLDPITIDTLDQMGEPTNLKDLLIRGTVMLATEEFIEPSSIKNHKIRSYDRLNSILYDEIARSLAAYKNQKGKKGAFSINPEAVLQRIIQDNAVISIEEINPMHDLKEKTAFTYTGVGGRTAQSFVVSDRQFPRDGVGVISEAVPDSPKVGISGYTVGDPNITNLHGMLGTVNDPTELDPTQSISISALTMPGSTNDDQMVTLSVTE